MTRYMLDTNICIHLIKHRTKALYDRICNLPMESVAVSGIVAAELWYGVALSQKKKQNEAALKDFLGKRNSDRGHGSSYRDACTIRRRRSGN